MEKVKYFLDVKKKHFTSSLESVKLTFVNKSNGGGNRHGSKNPFKTYG